MVRTPRAVPTSAPLALLDALTRTETPLLFVRSAMLASTLLVARLHALRAQLVSTTTTAAQLALALTATLAHTLRQALRAASTVQLGTTMLTTIPLRLATRTTISASTLIQPAREQPARQSRVVQNGRLTTQKQTF